MIGVTSEMHRKTAILPEGGRDFLRRRMMELVGAGVAGAGVVLLLVAISAIIPLMTVVNSADGHLMPPLVP